jgi:RNA polymerase-binding transcription factor
LHRTENQNRHNSVLSAGRGTKLAREQGARFVMHGVAMSSHEYGAAVLDKNKNYQPFDKEPFMNERQRDYFRQKLLTWRDEIVKQAKETLAYLQAEKEDHADLADRASLVTDREVELRARDRQRKLLAKIDVALSRLEDGTYGYCAETSEPISLKRLEARPIATLSVEAQERHERRERIYRDE